MSVLKAFRRGHFHVRNMRKPKPRFKAARYVDIQKDWRRLKPIYYSKTSAVIWKPCLLEYLECRMEQHGVKFKFQEEDRHEYPSGYDGCDWRCDRRGRRPEFWSFVCHSACHWLVDLSLFVACSAWPEQPWRILNGRKHSTVWNGDCQNPLLFDANFLALEVEPHEALQLAWRGRKLPVRKYLKNYLHKQTL